MLRSGIGYVLVLAMWALPAPNAFGEEVHDSTRLTVVVMDPLAEPLSCPCVEGYAQRRYEPLAEHLGGLLNCPVDTFFAESLLTALKDKSEGRVDLIIGKDSVVQSDAARAQLRLKRLAQLTGQDGTVTQTGLVVVRAGDPAQELRDLQGYRIILGPPSCNEKHDAVKALLQQAGLPLPEKFDMSEACSDGACQIIEWGDSQRAAAVISSYAQPLLEGCGTVEKGELRVVAETDAVPFITAFVNQASPFAARPGLSRALDQVAQHPELLTALESRNGFVPPAKDLIDPAKKK